MSDVSIGDNRVDGTLCTAWNGKTIVWRGHACEGANLTTIRDDNFCLWTRCGEHDVPANKAKGGRFDGIHCSACLEIIANERSA